MSKCFKLEIEMENAGMDSEEDIIMTLREVASQIEYSVRFDVKKAGPIRDVNGNLCGFWKLTGWGRRR